MPLPHPGRPLGGAAAAAALLLLAGCSGSRFGEALSRSFSSGGSPDTAAANGTSPAPPANSAGTPTTPTQAGSASSPTRAGSAPGAPSATGAAATATPRNLTTSGTGNAAAAAGPNRPATTPSTAPSAAAGNPAAAPRPAPYRVTILLPQADAAAPAEVVTQALRAAGVPFEVETIERLGRPPATPAAPLSRPAPEPR